MSSDKGTLHFFLDKIDVKLQIQLFPKGMEDIDHNSIPPSMALSHIEQSNVFVCNMFRISFCFGAKTPEIHVLEF